MPPRVAAVMAASLAVPSRCPKLKKLNLSGNPELSKMGETVAVGLTKLRKGLELVLDDNRVGDGGAIALADAVLSKRVPKLTSLELQRTGLEQDGPGRHALNEARALTKGALKIVFWSAGR